LQILPFLIFELFLISILLARSCDPDPWNERTCCRSLYPGFHRSPRADAGAVASPGSLLRDMKAPPLLLFLLLRPSYAVPCPCRTLFLPCLDELLPGGNLGVCSTNRSSALFPFMVQEHSRTSFFVSSFFDSFIFLLDGRHLKPSHYFFLFLALGVSWRGITTPFPPFS